MLLEIICQVCGQPYTPSTEDFRRGPAVYQRCPACRPADVASEKPGVAD